MKLFKEFFSSFEAGIAALQASCSDKAAETWRTQSHALKGIALNLGAMKLGDLCKKGQDEPHAAQEAKGELLKNILDEYERVKVFLQKVG